MFCTNCSSNNIKKTRGKNKYRCTYCNTVFVADIDENRDKALKEIFLNLMSEIKNYDFALQFISEEICETTDIDVALQRFELLYDLNSNLSKYFIIGRDLILEKKKEIEREQRTMGGW